MDCDICKDTIKFNEYELKIVQNMHEECTHVFHEKCMKELIKIRSLNRLQPACAICRATWESLTY